MEKREIVNERERGRDTCGNRETERERERERETERPTDKYIKIE